MLGYVDGRGAISGTDGGHHEIAPFGKPFGCAAEFHKWKEAAAARAHRNAVVHDHEWERAVTDRPHQVSEHRDRERQRPDLFLDLARSSLIFRARWHDQACKEQQHRSDQASEVLLTHVMPPSVVPASDI